MQTHGGWACSMQTHGGCACGFPSNVLFYLMNDEEDGRGSIILRFYLHSLGRILRLRNTGSSRWLRARGWPVVAESCTIEPTVGRRVVPKSCGHFAAGKYRYNFIERIVFLLTLILVLLVLLHMVSERV